MSHYIIEKELTGVGAFGEFEKCPLTFEGYNIVINGSFSQMKLEFFTDNESLDIILKFYEKIRDYGEGGEDFIKPIIGMKVERENEIIKSKTYIETEEISKFACKKDIKITIYYEPILDEYTLDNDYLQSNSHGIDGMGGLYYTVDMMLFIQSEDDDVIAEEYKDDKGFKVERYNNQEGGQQMKETGSTAIEMVKSGWGRKFRHSAKIR